MEETGTV